MAKVKVPIEVSARHVHASKEDFKKLFGPKAVPCVMKLLSQPGQYAMIQAVKLKGPKGEIDDVRILGPCRDETQVEISGTDARKLGVNAPVKISGDHKNTPGLTMVGPKGKVKLRSGVIIAERHLHISDRMARKLGLKDRDKVKIDVSGVRDLMFESVPVRVDPNFRLSFHIDTDEANAAWVQNGDTGVLIRYRSKPRKRKRRKR